MLFKLLQMLSTEFVLFCWGYLTQPELPELFSSYLLTINLSLVPRFYIKYAIHKQRRLRVILVRNQELNSRNKKSCSNPISSSLQTLPEKLLLRNIMKCAAAPEQLLLYPSWHLQNIKKIFWGLPIFLIGVCVLTGFCSGMDTEMLDDVQMNKLQPLWKHRACIATFA